MNFESESKKVQEMEKKVKEARKEYRFALSMLNCVLEEEEKDLVLVRKSVLERNGK